MTAARTGTRPTVIEALLAERRRPECVARPLAGPDRPDVGGGAERQRRRPSGALVAGWSRRLGAYQRPRGNGDAGGTFSARGRPDTRLPAQDRRSPRFCSRCSWGRLDAVRDAARRRRRRQRRAPRRHQRAGRGRHQRTPRAGGVPDRRGRRRAAPRTQGWNALHQTIRLRRTNIGHMPPPDGQGTLSSLDLIQRADRGRHRRARADDQADFRDGYRNRLNRMGATPFLLASKNVDTAVMRVLLDAGADPLDSQCRPHHPVDGGGRCRHVEPGRGRGRHASKHEPEALEAVRMLVELGNDVRAVNDRGETALHGAAYRGAPERCRVSGRAGGASSTPGAPRAGRPGRLPTACSTRCSTRSSPRPRTGWRS